MMSTSPVTAAASKAKRMIDAKRDRADPPAQTDKRAGFPWRKLALSSRISNNPRE